MHTQTVKTVLCLLASSSFFAMRAEDVTIFASTGAIQYLNIETNQTCELLDSDMEAVYFSKPNSPNQDFPMDIPGFRTSGRTFDSLGKRIVVGPATIKAVPNATGRHATFRVAPRAFAAEQTVIIPHLSNGANVALQVSSNLVDWVSTTNGAYSGTNGALFFRINLQRAP